MSDLRPADRRSAAATLVFARVVYAFNWYNVGAVLPLIGRGLTANTVELSIVLGAFLVGAAVFQVPAGLVALRWGYRRTSLFALGLMGAFCLASAASPDWVVLAVLRFGAGTGAAFFFAPALGLVSSYYPTGARGPVIGIYNAGFSIGAGVGLIGGAVVGSAFGWPWALAVGGAGLLLVGAAAALRLPNPVLTGSVPDWKATLGVGRALLRSRNLWALSLGLAGVWTAFYAAAQFFVQYSNAVHPSWSITLAAAVPTVMIFTEVLGGPLGGWLAERRTDMRRMVVWWSLATAVGIVIIPFAPLDGLWADFIFLGFADGLLFAVMYLIPTYLPEGSGPRTALAIAIVNSVQLFLGSAFAVLFGVIADAVNYTAAWAFVGLLTAGFLPFLAYLSVPRSGTPSPSGSPTST